MKIFQSSMPNRLTGLELRATDWAIMILQQSDVYIPNMGTCFIPRSDMKSSEHA